jgi:hypothetical protein
VNYSSVRSTTERRHEATSNPTKGPYEKPRIEVLGTFAGLTLGGGKTSGMSDLHSGFSHSGPGS